MNDNNEDSVDANAVRLDNEVPVIGHKLGHLDIGCDYLTYNMKHANRGKCLVFNHQFFDAHTGCRPRHGTEVDANALVKCFYDLDFSINLFNDASRQDLQLALNTVSKEDHSDRDCIVIIILSHGDEQSLWARDSKYPIDLVFTYFKGDRCPSLAGKPKIFIIQACRGDRIDSGTKILGLGMDVVDSPSPVYRIPTIADFLIYYSTAPGYYSFRNTTDGSFFIQTLVIVLKKYSVKYSIDLLTLLTIVNQRVAYGFESNVPNNVDYHKKKQIPCIASMLTRLIFFSKKQIKESII